MIESIGASDSVEERFSRALEHTAVEIRRMFDDFLPRPANAEARLLEAMRYAAIGGGKRLRPFLLLESAQLFDVAKANALWVATALECVHIHSLIHDDLPCMDNGAMRHGQPACHVKFDEATALLAGGALLSLGFELLADKRAHPDAVVRAELVERLAKATGAQGMHGGQMIDLVAHEVLAAESGGEGAEDAEKARNLAVVARMQRLKTGELFIFACEAGAILGQAAAYSRNLLRAYAHDIGLAFQITDDLLDRRADASRLGKDAGKDAGAAKLSFVSLMGEEAAEEQARMLAAQAVNHLEGFGGGADLLRHMARFIVERQF